MVKTVDKNFRDTVVELDGGECEVVFSAKYAAFALMNNGALNVVMSIEKGKAETDDGVRIIGSNESAVIAAPMLSDRLYVTGTGRVQISALTTLVTPFKPAAKGGGGGSGGGEINKINSISVNGTVLTPDANKKVEIYVPVRTSELTNDSNFQTDTQVQTVIADRLGDLNSAIAAHNADKTAHPFLLDEINKLGDRLLALEIASGMEVTANPFAVTFGSLDGTVCDGVWNTEENRLEF